MNTTYCVVQLLSTTCLCLAACDTPKLSQVPLNKGNAISNSANMEGLIWFDSVTSGDARYFDFKALLHGVANKGATTPSTEFGGTISDCSTDVVVCTHIGLPISFPVKVETKKWNIDQYSCQMTFDRQNTKTICTAKGKIEEGDIENFQFNSKNHCVVDFQFRVAGSPGEIFHYTARNKYICFDLENRSGF